MNLTERDARLIRRLNKPSHRLPFHLAAAAFMALGGVLNVVKGLRLDAMADVWLGALVLALGIFWAERLLHERAYGRLIEKLVRSDAAERRHDEHHEIFF